MEVGEQRRVAGHYVVRRATRCGSWCPLRLRSGNPRSSAWRGRPSRRDPTGNRACTRRRCSVSRRRVPSPVRNSRSMSLNGASTPRPYPPVAAMRRRSGSPRSRVRRGMVVQRGDQPVGQRAEQARSLQPGDLLLLEGVLHVLLDPRQMPAERAKGRVAGDRTAVLGTAQRAPRKGRRRPPRELSAGGVGSASARSVLGRRRVGNCQHRFQAVQCVQRLARGHPVRFQGGNRLGQRIGVGYRWHLRRRCRSRCGE